MQKKPQITIKNIKSYIEGNTKMFLADIGFQSEHLKEQIAYRTLVCSDCVATGNCKECGCDLPEKLYVNESCNQGKNFPNLMSNLEWQQFKKNNNIE